MSVKKNQMSTSQRDRNRRNGFTLLEVLVALLVLSIGLLGIGKLVMLSARANGSAYLRSQATALAYSMFDDMRANRTQALTPPYAYAVAIGVNPGIVGCPAPPAGCSPSQQAQNDLANWKSTLQNALPNGDGSVQIATANDTGTGAANVTVTVSVQWNDTVAQQVVGGPPTGTDTVVLETIL
jgi:type IV pilus assembly protein PilV